jgi:uncharacterized protein (TIGR02145 family)
MLTNGNDIITLGDNWLMPAILRHVTINQSAGGTITASRLVGYDGDSVSLDYSNNQDYYFNGYNVSGSTLYDANKFDFNGSDVIVSGNWTYDPTARLLCSYTKIGNQIWTVENFAYDDGGSGVYRIPNLSYFAINGQSTSSVWSFGEQYVYTYEAAMRIGNSIPGWHVPTDDDWNTLWSNVSNQREPLCAGDTVYNVDIYYQNGGWGQYASSPSSHIYGTNTTGFTARPFGYYLHNNGVGSGVGQAVEFNAWSATLSYDSSYTIYHMGMIDVSVNIPKVTYYNMRHFSYAPLMPLRLIKDNSTPPVCY